MAAVAANRSVCREIKLPLASQAVNTIRTKNPNSQLRKVESHSAI
jgi:hypothetical protein